MSKVRYAADRIWLELYIACIEDRVPWRSGVKVDNLFDMFSALRESGVTSRNITAMGVELLAAEDLVSISKNDFEELYVTLTDEGFSRADNDIGDPDSRIGKISALRGKAESANQIDANHLDNSAEIDLWEPIPVDRSSSEFAKAVETLDSVREQFRQENGYASQEPEKKAAILDAIEMGADIVRSKVLTRTTVKALILEPLYSIVRIFGTASIGEAAKVAITAIRAWLNI